MGAQPINTVFKRACIFVVSTLLLSGLAYAQINVTTYHNDLARTGLYAQETVLTPANVNSNQFGKLFSTPVDGAVFAQPLYLSAVAIGGGTHNVLYAATEHDSVYAIDADSGSTYAHVNLIPPGGTTVSGSDVYCGDITPEIGITGTPVIDAATGTLYVVAKSKVNGTIVQYLHALDVNTLAEKFNGPVQIQFSVAGSGYDSSGGRVTFNAHWQNQRAALLLQNGHVVIGWAAHCDQNPWHGWVVSYNARTLGLEAIFNASPSGSQGGIWMSGGGFSADASGNLYFATGNGSWNGTSEFGDSIIKLGPPSGGAFPLLDYFTPFNQASMSNGDADLGSGGLVLLPKLGSGRQLLAQQSKQGTIYLLDTSNLGQYCPARTPPCSNSDSQIVQEIRNASSGVWGSPAYWNGNIYWTGANDAIKAYSVNANTGLLSTSPTSQSAQIFAFSAPTPAVSANGISNAILWAIDGSADTSTCVGGSTCLGLYAYDATDLSHVLYISSQAANNRDSPGVAVKFATPIIANGKVYVGTNGNVSAYGLLAGVPPVTATPTFSPAGGSYGSAQSVSIADATPGATIYYTTNGSTPNTASAVYSGAITVNASETLRAIAVASGYSSSPVGSATYTIGMPAAATPTFSPAGGSYGSAQSVSIADATPGATIYYTTNGSTPNTASAVYSGAITVNASETLRAIAVASGYSSSPVGSATYTIGMPAAATPTFSPAGGSYGSAQSVSIADATPGATIYYTTNGSTPSTASAVYSGAITVNASETLRAIAVASGYSSSPVGSATYTIGMPAAATPTFSPAGGSYGSAQSVSIADATPGATIYYTTNGSTPNTASAVYSGAITVNASETLRAIAVASGYSSSPVGSATYTIGSGSTTVVDYGSGFASANGLSFVGGVTLSGGALVLTNNYGQGRAAWYATPVNVQSFTTDFNFQISPANGNVADGFTFTLQNAPAGAKAIGASGGGLGYQGLVSSLAVKFDLYNNAGEGTDSTGFYTNGAPPTLPALDMTASAVNLHNGNILHAHITYNGTTLTLILTDTVTNASFTASTTIDIPGTLGANAAYAGFTGGTGGAFATQDILNWTYAAGAATPVTATPTFSPAGGSYGSAQSVSIADATPGATIYYTTNGSTPSTASAVYSGAITVNASETLRAIAVASGYSSSPVGSATYTIGMPAAATPTFSPAGGSYGSAQSVSIADATPGATIYYTTNGSTPNTASAVYSGAITVNASETLRAIAVASGYSSSPVGSATYTIGSGSTTVVDYGSGFASANGLSFVGGVTLSGGALVLTNNYGQGRAAWYATPVNVQSFTTDFNFQISPANGNVADGFTFTLQNAPAGAKAIGASGGGLGYQGLVSSLAVKFDLYNNAGEGTDSTGFYTNGAPPTLPALDMTASAVNLHNGNILHAHITYNGTTLTLILTDTVTNASFTASTTIDIPGTLGANAAYAGFTGGTGGAFATQDILNWTYQTG